MKYIETNSLNPYYNLAFEEYILNNCKSDDYLLLWQNDNTIVFGLHQNPFEEINLNEAEKLNVNIVRRITGGGTVYHDLGNLNFSYITDWNNGENANYEHFLKPIVNAFGEVGLDIEIKGRNDLLLDGKKNLRKRPGFSERQDSSSWNIADQFKFGNDGPAIECIFRQDPVKGCEIRQEQSNEYPGAQPKPIICRGH